MGQFGVVVSTTPFRWWNVCSFGMSPKCKSSHCRREACRRKIRSSTCPNRTAMRAVYPNIRTLIKSMLTTSCTTASVERAVYQDGGFINILAKSLRRRTIELQLLWLLCIVMWKWITRNQYRTSYAASNVVNCLLLKRLFSKYDAWLIFCSDNMATNFEASCRAF